MCFNRRWLVIIWGLVLGFILVLGIEGCGSKSAGEQVAMATIQAHQATQISALEAQNARQRDALSYLLTQMPRSTIVPTPYLITLTPTPWENNPAAAPITPALVVEGSVVLEGGRCCVGGIANTTIGIEASFEAYSPVGQVTDMRVLAGGSQVKLPEEIEKASWEDFSPVQTFELTLPLNWVGFYVSVQYRDVQGNLSPVYWDDISVEGMPPEPSPTP